MTQYTNESVSPYMVFNREEWRALRLDAPMTLSEEEIELLQGINENLSIQEVTDVYLPLARLLNLYTEAVENLHAATGAFLNKKTGKVPFIIGIAGSVAVGKSTTARIIQALLSRLPGRPAVDLITTDGFLYPNAELERRGLMSRKGFPESYNVSGLLRVLASLKSGAKVVDIPQYSHLVYDVLDEEKTISNPDIVIVEGINVLQTPATGAHGGQEAPANFVSDFFDFSIYVDAPEADIKEWYIERFLMLRDTAFIDEKSYFHKYAGLSDKKAVATAADIWERINRLNLHENILPTRNRARLILKKSKDHTVSEVKLKKL